MNTKPRKWGLTPAPDLEWRGWGWGEVGDNQKERHMIKTVHTES